MFDQDDIHSAALCAWKEARGDGLTGMHAVLHCLKNRVGAVGFAHTLHDVIYGKNQFTSMSVPSDPEFNLDPGAPIAFMFAEAMRLAECVLNTDDADPTGGAHYYDNPKTATSGWFVRVIAGPDGRGTFGHEMTVKIDHHTFYR
jgi:N-acetylmuramoyl-L-alanine amidase